MRRNFLKTAASLAALALLPLAATADTWPGGEDHDRAARLLDPGRAQLRHRRHEEQRAAFGPDVNLANIDVRTICDTEALRIGLGTAGPLPE